MAHKCFISFKKEDESYKLKIQNDLKIDMLDYSLDTPILSDDEDHILRKLRENHISKTTVTIHLIGQYSSESLGWEEQKYIKRELQASLYHGVRNTQSGILGVVLPNMYESVYQGSGICQKCGNSHNYINLKDTTILEFSSNYYIPKEKGCSWSEDDRFCVLAKWEDFAKEPEKYINQAFNKRELPIAEKTRVRI
jgi:hypothetical protein